MPLEQGTAQALCRVRQPLGPFAVSLAAMSSEPTAPSQPPSQWLLVNLLCQLAFGLLAMTMNLPSMQEWGELLNGSPAAVQLTFSAYLVSYGALSARVWSAVRSDRTQAHAAVGSEHCGGGFGVGGAGHQSADVDRGTGAAGGRLCSWHGGRPSDGAGSFIRGRNAPG